jgi:hypothetical protein
MNFDQIRQAIEEGKKVHWVNTAYTVIKDSLGKYLIVHTNGTCEGLYRMDVEPPRMKYPESDFFTA